MAMLKKEVHAAKVNLMKRVRTVAVMSLDELLAEAGKLYPGMTIKDPDPLELAAWIINDAIDKELPDKKVLY